MISKNLCEQLIEVETTRQVVSDAVRDPISGISTCWSGQYTLLQLLQGKNDTLRQTKEWLNNVFLIEYDQVITPKGNFLPPEFPFLGLFDLFRPRSLTFLPINPCLSR